MEKKQRFFEMMIIFFFFFFFFEWLSNERLISSQGHCQLFTILWYLGIWIYGTWISQFPRIVWALLKFLFYEKFMGKSMYFPCDETYHRMRI